MAQFLTGAAGGNVSVLYDAIRAQLLANGWTVLQTIASRNEVFQGAELDAGIGNRPILWLDTTAFANWILNVYAVDWDPATHTLLFPVGMSGSRTNSGYTFAGVSTYYISANSLFYYTAAQGSNTGIYGGFLRRMLSPGCAGVAKAPGALTAGQTVITVSADMRGKLYVGQKVLTVNFSHDSTSVNKERLELHLIDAISATQITFHEALSGNFDAGAIIGENPFPGGCGRLASLQALGDASAWYKPWKADASAQVNSPSTTDITNDGFRWFLPQASGGIQKPQNRLNQTRIFAVDNTGGGVFMTVGCPYLVNSVHGLGGGGTPPNLAIGDVVGTPEGVPYVVTGIGSFTGVDLLAAPGMTITRTDMTIMAGPLADTDSGAAALTPLSVVAPVVSNFAPARPGPIQPTETIGFDVTVSDGTALANVSIAVLFQALSEEAVFDGFAFSTYYKGSSVTVIANGLRFVLKRQGGWPAQPFAKVRAVTVTGMVNT